MLVGHYAKVERRGEIHLQRREIGEESGFENWAGGGRDLKLDGSDEAEGEEKVDFTDFVFEVLEKRNARDKRGNLYAFPGKILKP